MIYSPGDLFDKCTILHIKLKKGLSVKEEFEGAKAEVGKIFLDFPETKNIYNDLFLSNFEQFELEDKIRVEKDLTIVGTIALDIREHNDRRVEIKNKINQITKQGFEEVKKYKRN